MSFQQDGRKAEGRSDHDGMGPSPPYPQSTPAQFGAPNFQQYPSEYPSLDNDLNMTDHFPHPMNTQLQEAAGPVSQRNGDVNNISVNTNGSISAGMGPPQTPLQSSFSPTEPRASIDETPTSAGPSEQVNKRRRSKVSRACDECRRKKIKCDSTDTADGIPTTCSNCAKGSNLCEFSRIPMKRGPSKGYIKELSERVEKMESRQASFSQPGYRQSLDGSSLPDEVMSGKRQFSFSEDVRNPFATMDYSRERMPSLGGAWSHDGPIGVGSRDRGSVALAPDQRLLETPAVSWGETDDIAPPPAKRQKTITNSISVQMVPEDLEGYYDGIHLGFPMLPDSASAFANILNHAKNTEALKILKTVVRLLPASSRSANQDSNNSKPVGDGDTFPTAQSLHKALGWEMRGDPYERSVTENIVLMWSCALLAVQREFDICTIRTDLSPATRVKLLKVAYELAEIMAQDDEAIISLMAQRAKTFINIMIRFDWLAMGNHQKKFGASTYSFKDIPEYQRADYEFFTEPELKLLVPATRCFSILQHMISSHLAFNSEVQLDSKLTMLEMLACAGLGPNLGYFELGEPPLAVRQVLDYIRISLSLFQDSLAPPIEVMQPVLNLARSLVEYQSDGNWRYYPIEFHLYTLTITVLILFLDHVPDQRVAPQCSEALGKLKLALEKKIDAYGKQIQSLGDFYGKDDDGSEVRNRTWMEALLKLMQDHPQENWAITKDGGQSIGGLARHLYPTHLHGLLESGYGRILAAFAGRAVPIGD